MGKSMTSSYAGGQALHGMTALGHAPYDQADSRWLPTDSTI